MEPLVGSSRRPYQGDSVVEAPLEADRRAGWYGFFASLRMKNCISERVKPWQALTVYLSVIPRTE
jgi:hypothetical protein